MSEATRLGGCLLHAADRSRSGCLPRQRKVWLSAMTYNDYYCFQRLQNFYTPYGTLVSLCLRPWNSSVRDTVLRRCLLVERKASSHQGLKLNWARASQSPTPLPTIWALPLVVVAPLHLNKASVPSCILNLMTGAVIDWHCIYCLRRVTYSFSPLTLWVWWSQDFHSVKTLYRITKVHSWKPAWNNFRASAWIKKLVKKTKSS